MVLDVLAVAALLVFPARPAPAAGEGGPATARQNNRRRLLVTALATLLVGVPTGLVVAMLLFPGGKDSKRKTTVIHPPDERAQWR